MNEQRPAAQVVLARNPGPDTMRKIKQFAESRGCGRGNFEIDPGIIGGVVIYIGDTVYDGSVKSRLEHIKGSL